MLMLPPSVRIFLAAEPADMRRGFDGLAYLVKDLLKEDPSSGHLFVFRNRRGDRLKILYWDRSGYCLFYKRLEQGSFHFPSPGSDGRAELEAGELLLLLEGIELRGAKRRERFTLSGAGI